MNVRWTETAVDHLQAIHDYFAQNSPTYARRIVDRLTRRSAQIAALPRSGQLVPEYGDDAIREVYERPFRIIYRVLPDQIDILAVIHGTKQLPPHP